ncbi:MAG TPA: hypothetical protein PKM88_00725 [bacterium]|nr:hypothetical protein [bacterium]
MLQQLPTHDPALRRALLAQFTADPVVQEALLAYNAPPFAHARLPERLRLPLADEPHVADWRAAYLDGSTPADAFARLRAALPQWSLPVRAGLSTTDEYRAVMRCGEPVPAALAAEAPQLAAPGAITLAIIPHFAGALPVITTDDHADFACCVRVMAGRSEPVAVPAAVNAMMVAGMLNWDRIRRYRAAWTAAQPHGDWSAEQARIAREEPWRLFDRFVLLNRAPYSGCSAAALGLILSDDKWLAQSMIIRCEHEFTHYATKRLFDTMRNNLLDELIADAAGLLAARGAYEPALARQFLGVEQAPAIRAGGRLHAYCSDLPEAARPALAALAAAATDGIAAGVRTLALDAAATGQRARFMLALTALTVELLAAPGAAEHIAAAWHALGPRLATE